MHPYLSKAMAEARQDDLLRQAEHHRLVRAARSGRQSWLSRRIDALRARRFRRSTVGGLQPAALGGFNHPEVAVGVGESGDVGPGFADRRSDQLGTGSHRLGG